MILGLQQGLKEDGVEVSLVKLCEWFGVARRTVYYQATKGQPKLQEQFVRPIKAMIEENPSFGYRTVAHLLEFNKNTVQRVFQLMGWQVRKRPVGFRPRIQALPSVAKAPDERWATDLCRVWAGKDGWSCIDPVKNCSGVIFEGNTYEHTDGRRHQTLDGQAQSSLGHGDYSRQNHGSRGQSIF